MEPWETVSRRLMRALAASAVAAVLWRLAVATQLVTGSAAPENPTQQLALGLLGLTYLTCGLAAFLGLRTPASALFALYGIAQGVHWGGPLAVAGDRAQLAIYLLYFTVTMLGTTAVLHFVLLYPRPWRLAFHRGALALLYAPFAVAALMGAGRLLLPETSSLGKTLQDLFFLLETIQVNLFPVVAIAILAVRVARADAAWRRASGLGILLAGALIAVLPYVLALILEAVGFDVAGGSELAVWFFIVEPATFAYVLLSRRNVARQGLT